jgi:hypothetical protein
MPDERVTLTLKLDPRVMARIDREAAAQGQNRKQYVLSWLPDYHEWRPGDNAADTTRRIDEHSFTAR